MNFDPFEFSERCRRLLAQSNYVAGHGHLSRVEDQHQIYVKSDVQYAFIEGEETLTVPTRFGLEKVGNTTKFEAQIDMFQMPFPFYTRPTRTTFVDHQYTLTFETAVRDASGYLNAASAIYDEKRLNGIQFRKACMDFNEVLTMFRPAEFTFIFSGGSNDIYGRWLFQAPFWDRYRRFDLRFNYRTNAWTARASAADDSSQADDWFPYTPYAQLRDMFANLFENEWKLDVIEPIAFAQERGEDIGAYKAALDRLLASEL